MTVRPIDANELLKKFAYSPADTEDEQIFNAAARKIIREAPTLTPPNEPMLERVVREYLEICGNDCAGDPSVGIPECPFYQYADVLDNGALIQPKCELAAYRRPPEGET